MQAEKHPSGLLKALLSALRTELLPSGTQTSCLKIGRKEGSRLDRDLNFDLNEHSPEIGLKHF